MKTEQSLKSSRLSTDINNTNSRPKLEEEKPFMGEEVAKTLIVDEIDDEGYIKLHSRRRIRNDIYEQQFYKIHADQVNKIIEMAVQYGNETEYFAHLFGKCKDCNTSKR